MPAVKHREGRLARVEENTDKREKKLPLFVTVYETMYNRLREGTYAPGEKLPGESELAEELKVSRGTLRQALLLLQEDGLIMNYQGKGSFVLGQAKQLDTGIEKLNNPLVLYTSHPVDRVRVDLQFQVATEKHREQFDLRPSTLISMMEIIYYSGEIPTGLAQVFMPYDILADSQVALDDTDAVYRFYNEFLETGRLNSESLVRQAYARKSTAEMLNIKEGAPMLMMEEKIYQGARRVIFQKLFMLPDYYVLKLSRRNDRYSAK